MIRHSLTMLLLLTLITGVLYPALVTAVAQLTFPAQAHGNLIKDNGAITGSTLIGRQFTDPRYFWPRPSATAPLPYNAASSSGSNYGPNHPAVRNAVAQRRAALIAADPSNPAPIPADLLTASGSGLDPHISPAAAEYQAPRIARLRRIPLATLNALIAAHTEHRQFGILGEPRVNVLLLNRALDQSPDAQ